MLYHFEYVNNAGIYSVNNDVIDFFQKSITRTRFSTSAMSDNLKKVVADSIMLESKFKDVFVELNRAGIDKTVVFNFLSNNNNVVELLTNVNYPLLTLEKPLYDNLIKKIRNLYLFIWSSTFNTLTCSNTYGTLDHHYQEHDTLNKKSRRICPFCGLSKLDDPIEKRNEYDHYLDKGTYPYLALNFNNLVPMCGKCNKRPNKGTQNLIFDTKGNRRIAYYPYSSVKSFEIKLNCKNLFMPTEKWILTSSSSNPDIGFKTWKTVFKIDSRYANYIKSEYSFWIDSFTTYYHGNLPTTIIEFKQKIESYVEDVLKIFQNDLGYMLHVKFWNYLVDVQDSDLELVITLMDEKSKF
ncbi:hypothetical protein [Flavobacterium terrisoli]|uniref:hypothetical protein n=1 Tax=Flavobacterium terrisoli TaxID=3242195 RepID=UPI002543D763|nr:hypothetical protein [Flavobacterium buctense]